MLLLTSFKKTLQWCKSYDIFFDFKGFFFLENRMPKFDKERSESATLVRLTLFYKISSKT